MKRIQQKRDCSPTTLPIAPSVGVKVEAGGSVLVTRPDRLERISVIVDRLEIISANDRAFSSPPPLIAVDLTASKTS
jgi:hypothetical protein